MKRYVFRLLIAITFIFTIGLYVSSSIFAEQAYIVIDLGTLGGISSFARGINNNGKVVGQSSEGGLHRAFIWDSENGMQSLAVLPVEDWSRAYAINDGGEAVGEEYHGPPGEQAFIWDSENGMQSLDAFPNGSSDASDINNQGLVVGKGSPPGVGVSHAFIWDNDNGMRELGFLPGGTMSLAKAINENNQVVGRARTSNSVMGHAFIWDADNGMQDLGTLAGDVEGAYSEANDINEIGQVVGYSTSVGETAIRAFLWDNDNGMQNLSTLEAHSEAWAINDFGQIVGEFNAQTGRHAFIWDNNNGMRDLNDLISEDSKWVLDRATDINNSGQIVGGGKIDLDGDGTYDEGHAFLLTPLPCNYNGICNPPEDCITCPEDCIGKTKGKRSERYCCGDGVCENEENGFNCEVDCGPPSCEEYETSCTDGIDNDCDGFIDCIDEDDCSEDFACICLPKGELCSSDDECCSNKCRGKPGESQCR